MRWIKRIALFLFLSLLLFVIYTMATTGFFRSIDKEFEGKLLHKISLPGAEDIIISRQDSFALISSTHRGSLTKETHDTGDLYWMDLRNRDFTPVLLTGDFEQEFAPHGISYLKLDSTYLVMAVNHTSSGHSIEVFELKDTLLEYQKTITHPSIVSPNDLVIIDEERFYFTNDHKYVKGFGRFLEDYGGLGIANVVYFDGQTFKEVAEGIAYSNGINFDASRNLLFVASPRDFLVKVYARQEDGSLQFIEDIDCGTGVDNIEFGKDGKLWIGCHPNLLRFSAYSEGMAEISPSEIITIYYRGKGDYTIEQIYVEDGSDMSAATVAATFERLIFVGNVMDEAFLILEQD